MSKCKVCKCEFTRNRPLQPVCDDFKCRVAYALIHAEKSRQNREKSAKREIRKRKEALKTRRDYINEAQQVFNRYIRTRDSGKPCICCGRQLAIEEVGGGYDCGHYRSVGSAPHLRFDERNAHAQTKQCNRWGAGRAVDYRLGLIARIGLDQVEALESDNTPRKWSIDELKEITATYKAKLKELEKL